MSRNSKNQLPAREELIHRIGGILAKAGFFVTKCSGLRSMTFDLIARRDRDLILIKILRNIDGFSRDVAAEMIRISVALEGRPLVIGLHSGSGKLEDGIVYTRFEVPIVTPETLEEELLEGIPPFIIAEPGGLYVKIDGELLRRVRENMNLSLGTLAEIAGVSRRAIQMYEGGMKAMIDVAQRLEEYFNRPLVQPLIGWEIKDMPEDEAAGQMDDLEGFEGEVFRQLTDIGYSVIPTRKSAFDAITRNEEDVLIAWLAGEVGELADKMDMFQNIMRVAERNGVVFVERSTERETIRGVPVVERDELLSFEYPDELTELTEKRRTAGKKG